MFIVARTLVLIAVCAGVAISRPAASQARPVDTPSMPHHTASLPVDQQVGSALEPAAGTSSHDSDTEVFIFTATAALAGITVIGWDWRRRHRAQHSAKSEDQALTAR